MIFVKAKNAHDLHEQLKGMFPYTLWKDKVKFHEETWKIDLCDEYVRITENPDEITIWIPTKYKDRNVFLYYTDKPIVPK